MSEDKVMMRDEEAKESEPFRFRDPKQQRIFDNLNRLVGPGPATFYCDACRVMKSREIESVVNLVAHLFREIESALRDVLELLPVDSKGYNSREKEKVSKLCDKVHTEEIKTILLALDIDETDPVARAWLQLADKNSHFSLHRLAHRDALALPHSMDNKFWRFLSEFETVLDVVLERFENIYLNVFKQLDNLLTINHPTSKYVSILRNNIPNNLVSHGYFFDRLVNPEWILPLKKKHFFENPPKIKRDEVHGTINFPPWPVSRYLARMASLERNVAEIVLNVILNIPDTDNVRVCEDYIDATLAMSPDLAANLILKAMEWAKLPYQSSLPEKLGSLVSHLAKGGQIDNALKLAQTLLEVLPDQHFETKREDKSNYLLPKPHARFDDWDYEQIIKNNISDLVQIAGMQAFSLICDLLEKSIRYSHHIEDDKRVEDYSYIWRPAIEDHVENLQHGIEDILVSAVRDATEQIVKANSKEITQIVQALEDRNWCVFHRIALNLLRQFPEIEPDLIANRLLNRSLFGNVYLRHEYILLLRERFEALNSVQQQVILDWIKEGPNVEVFKESYKQRNEKDPTDEDVERYYKMWQRDRLSIIELNLPKKWKNHYKALVAEFGEPVFTELIGSEGWIGLTSPKTSDEFRAMSVTEIIGFLRTWKPSQDLRSPSPEGLGRELSSVIAQDPEQFAEEAENFKGLDPTYVRALLSGLREAIKNGKYFDWHPVIGLCKWVIKQPRSVQKDYDYYRVADLDWGWTRKEIANLLSTGFAKNEVKIPYRFRKYIWSVLQPITEDPEPTSEYEAKYGGSNMDPVTLSINTVRGEAMHAVVHYALWVRRHIEAFPGGKILIDKGFDEIPEVREVLELHLDPEYDPSLAIRAVYGQWFPQLVLLAPEWAKENISKIFPNDEKSQALRDAAWETYVIFCPSYDNVFEILLSEYKRAVDRIAVSTGDRRRFADPDRRLAEHLITFYWRGKLGLGDKERLLTQFWEKASDELAAHALEFVGRNLRNTKGKVPPEIIERLKTLWLIRLEVAKIPTSGRSHAKELAAFGWWFASGKLDDRWAIEQLRETLKVARSVEPNHLVVKRLAELVKNMPSDTVGCLSMIVRVDKEGWGILGHSADMREILVTALRSEDAKAKQVATDLIHYLGSRGYLEFGELLRQN